MCFCQAGLWEEQAERYRQIFMSYKRFKQEVLRNQCRNCINQTYGIQLKRQDCAYLIYPTQCRCCGQMRNIVVDVAPMARWKLLLRRKKQNEI